MVTQLDNSIREGTLGEAEAALAVATRSSDPLWRARAALKLGRLQDRRDAVDGASRSYELAISSGRADVASRAALLLARMLERHGAVVAAKENYRRAIECGDASMYATARWRRPKALPADDGGCRPGSPRQQRRSLRFRSSCPRSPRVPQHPARVVDVPGLRLKSERALAAATFADGLPARRQPDECDACVLRDERYGGTPRDS